MKVRTIKNITKRSYSERKKAYCVSVDSFEREVLFEGKSGRQYRVGQSINFGVCYCQSSYGLARGLNISQKEAEEFLKNYFNKFKKLAVLIVQAKNTLQKNYAIWTLLKRKRRFPKYAQAKKEKNWKLVAHMERQATNSISQGCKGPDTKVLVEGMGYVCIKDVYKKHGMKNIKIWDGDAFVNAICMKSGKKEKVNIELWGGVRDVSSPNHLFLTQHSSGGEGIWKTPSQFSISKNTPTKVVITNKATWSNNINIPEEKIKGTMRKCSFNDIKDKIILGEILGRLASDGSIGKGTSGCVWIIAEHEEDIIPRVLEGLNKFGVVRKYIRKAKRHCKEDLIYLNIDAVRLSRQARDMNLKTCIPDVVWQDSDVLKGFLRGMIDGDGGISGKAIVLTFGRPSVNTQYPEDIQQALMLFGIKSRIHRYEYRVEVQISTPDNALFQKEIGFMSKVKKEKLKDLVDRWTPTRDRWGCLNVKNVCFTKEKIQMYDIVNSDSGKFVANGIITHNSAADIIKVQMRELAKVLPKYDAHLQIQIHDEVIVECPEGKAKEVLKVVKDTMEQAIKLPGVPIKADGFVSKFWKK